MLTLSNRSFTRWLILSVALVSLGGAGLLVGRALSEPGAKADDPISKVDQRAATPIGTQPTANGPSTPVAGATPDKSKPDWYVPYLEEEAAAPKFHGELNGIQLGVEAGPTPVCARPYSEPDWEEATAGTPFDLNRSRWPRRVSLFGMPDVGRCADDGRVMWIIAILEVAPGADVNGVTGVVQVSRGEVVRWYRQEFLADKVTTGTIAGRPAVFADVGLSGIGQTAVIVFDKETGGSTMLISSNVGLEYLKIIAEALY